MRHRGECVGHFFLSDKRDGAAARHSPESSPIAVSAARDGAHVAVSVADQGRGVAPERLPHLFRKHAPADGAGGPPTRQGLGLAICKGLVEAHGGRIRAESAGPGQGARFTFTLPVAGPGPAGSGGEAPGSAPEGRERTRILVVDDDPRTLRFVRDALLEAGYAPLVTGEPGELARLIRTERPALVLLDLMLPDTDGIRLMERIPELADLPVIFISGYRGDETIARALERGAADYIVKPFSLSAGRVVTTDTLLRRVWGRRGGDSEPVRTFVKTLRQKLGDNAASPAYIFNVRGVGYRLPKPDGA